MKIKENITVGIRYPEDIESRKDIKEYSELAEEEFPFLNEHTLEGLIIYDRQGTIDYIFFTSVEESLFVTEYHEVEHEDFDDKSWSQAIKTTWEEMKRRISNQDIQKTF